MLFTRLACFSCFLAAIALSPASADDLISINGKKTSGKLIDVDASGITFRTNDIDVKVPAKEILAVDLGRKVAPVPKDATYTEIELTDGSIFRCGKFLIKGKSVVPTLLAGPAGVSAPTVEMPLSSVFTVMKGAEDSKFRDEWKKMLVNRGKRDLWVIRLAEGLNFLPGTLLEGNEAGDAVTFEREDGKRSTLRLSRASGGLVFNQASQAAPPPTLCKVVDVFGDKLLAQSIQFEGSAVKVTTVAGAVVTYPSLRELSKLDYGQGNILYLSDLEPKVTAPESDPLEPRFTWNKDKNQVNEPLRVEGQTFTKGLWIFADTTLTFTIDGDYATFKALVGLDDSISNSTTAVKLTIEADGRTLFSESLKRTSKSKALNLDVKGVKQLKISVESETPYNGSQVILAEARVQK